MNTMTETRERILDAARDLFAERGYRGTTVRDITTAAKANIAAIGYYFESKDGLYAAVLQSLVGPLDERVRWACHLPRPPLDRVEFLARAVFDHIRLRPQMPGIMVRELAGGDDLNPVVIGTFSRLLPVITQVIKDGQRDGTIREGDPVLLVTSILAQPIYLGLARRMLSRLAGLDLQNDATAQRMADHVAAIVRAALARPSDQAPAAPPRTSSPADAAPGDER